MSTGGEMKLRLERVGDSIALTCPGVGVWRRGPILGAAVFGGASAGVLSVLGVDHPLVVPKGVAGRVTERFGAPYREPEVQFGDPLLRLSALSDEAGAVVEARGASVEAGLAYRAPMAGRFYLRPAPDAPPFVEVGAEITKGQTVCLLEVMKTFNRLALRGEDIPERVRVLDVVAEDGADVSRGDVLLRLEPC